MFMAHRNCQAASRNSASQRWPTFRGLHLPLLPSKRIYHFRTLLLSPFPFFRQRDGFRKLENTWILLECPLVPREREENLEEIDSVLLRSARPASRMAERTTRTAANLFSSGAKRPGISVDSAPREFLREIRRYSILFPIRRAKSSALKSPPFRRTEFSLIFHFIRLTVGAVAQVKDFDCSRSPCGCKLEATST